MAEICTAAIARVVNFNVEILLTVTSKTVAIAVLVSLPILSVMNMHAWSLWSAAIGIRSYCKGGWVAAETAIRERVKEEDGVDIQCVICLCDVSEGEVYRLLPGCNHGFHVSCIDAWLHTHSTCPLCRRPVPCTSVKNARNREEQYLIDAILSHFHRFLDHICKWFVNPLGFDQLTSTLSEDYRSFL